MSVEGQIDLDGLIQQEKKQARFKKHKQIEKQRLLREEQRRRYHQEKRMKFQQRQQYISSKNSNNKQPSFNSYYALRITGLLSDVSIDDICVILQKSQKLLGNRKIISIKTILRNRDLQPIDSSTASLMDVVVVLADKSEADSFVKTYSQKKLDGKYQLAFTFINPNDELQ